MTTRKQTAFTANTQFAPINGKSMPPRAGPIIPEIFSCKPLKVAADGNSASETTSGTIAVQAGALKANPVPIRNTKASKMYGFSSRNEARRAREPAATANQRFIVEINFRRSTISAKAPAGRVNKKKGKDATVDINDKNKVEGLSLYITQVAAQS